MSMLPITTFDPAPWQPGSYFAITKIKLGDKVQMLKLGMQIFCLKFLKTQNLGNGKGFKGWIQALPGRGFSSQFLLARFWGRGGCPRCPPPTTDTIY